MGQQINIVISGRVQGVMFRQSVKSFAEANNICGFAENTQGGDVKIIAQGEPDDLLALFSYCHTGPLLAKVKSIKGEWSEIGEKFIDFKVKRNGKNILEDQINAFTNLGKEIVNIKQIPKHIVIIPDGSRRWAKEKKLPEVFGHREGAKKIKEFVNFLVNTETEHLTIWGFSTENWSRQQKEVDSLMKIFLNSIKEMAYECEKNKIKFRHLGRKTELSQEVLDALKKLETDTENYGPKNINLALDYGGRDEIIRAIQKIKNIEQIGKMNEENFGKLLDTKDVPDPDLIIRTSGEKRLSGILPWQSTYAELYFTDKHFPDFNRAQLSLAVEEYSSRKRRLGK